MLPLCNNTYWASRGTVGHGGRFPDENPMRQDNIEVKALGFAMEQVQKEVAPALQSKEAILEKRRNIARDLHLPLSQVKVCTMEVTNSFVDTIRGPGAGNITQT
mmetsp:Transcript_50481/g.156198  ORF Transcript_50481/g.156198 Transcript_50481/m.156198 type:complete len:104 (+) Transcript_50481:88-399(+)